MPRIPRGTDRRSVNLAAPGKPHSRTSSQVCGFPSHQSPSFVIERDVNSLASRRTTQSGHQRTATQQRHWAQRRHLLEVEAALDARGCGTWPAYDLAGFVVDLVAGRDPTACPQALQDLRLMRGRR